jgi:16S rRNA (cytidine1402-2'-O)-methyltransferase
MQLFLIPVPLADDTTSQVLPPQIAEIVSGLDVFFVENIRTARRFISGLKLGKVIDNLTFYELSKDTHEAETATQLKKLLKNNQNAGVLSEAGCPAVADPGSVAVKLAHQLNIEIMPLVGPSSILLALMASGMNGQSFVFHGYLPIEKDPKLKAIRQLEADARSRNQAQIFIETPFRNNQILDDMLTNCRLDTRLCIACNLTAPSQFAKTLSIKDWKNQRPELHKKPTVFVIGI